jgi:hypothetical protein
VVLTRTEQYFQRQSGELVVLSWEDIPEVPLTDEFSASHQVATLLRKLMERHNKTRSARVMLPDIHSMANFLKCSPEQILEAFRTLKLQGIQYEFISLSDPVSMHYAATSPYQKLIPWSTWQPVSELV